ncbi:hypothetical protein EV715DRAFT_196844 [Schizophyllum commune]
MAEQTPTPVDALSMMRLKRQRDVLQERLDQLFRKKDPTHSSFKTAARGARKLVSMFITASDLQDEVDRRDEFGDPTVDPSQQRRADRKRDGYKLLTVLLGEHLRDVLADDKADILGFWVNVWNISGVARAEDNGRVRACLATWLNDVPYEVRPMLRQKNREGRGLSHDHVGEYLVSIKIKWSDPAVRKRIRAGDSELRRHGGFWFNCLYPKCRGDAADLEKNFLRGSLLVKTFCAIFTADVSADDVDDDVSDDEPSAKRQKVEHATKQNVSKLLKMNGKATPRSIAYAAVLLHFNLTDAKTWSDVYQGVNYPEFYNFIIDYFENNDITTPIGRLAQTEADATLHWFSQQAFPIDTETAIEVEEAWGELAAQRAKKLAAAEARAEVRAAEARAAEVLGAETGTREAAAVES